VNTLKMVLIPVRTFPKLPLGVRESDLAILATWPSILHSKFVWEVLLAGWSVHECA